MKVLFLDIDGVLNSHRTAYAFGGFPYHAEKHRNRFDDVAIALVRNVVQAAGAHIVLSSSWRDAPDWQSIGPALGLTFFDRTPRLAGPRGEEIAAWLAAHPEVESYVILDDDGDMLDSQRERFVQTKHEDGLTYADAMRIAELFACSTSDVLRTVRPAA